MKELKKVELHDLGSYIDIKGFFDENGTGLNIAEVWFGEVIWINQHYKETRMVLEAIEQAKEIASEIEEMIKKADCLEVALFDFRRAYKQYIIGQISKGELDGVFQNLQISEKNESDLLKEFSAKILEKIANETTQNNI